MSDLQVPTPQFVRRSSGENRGDTDDGDCIKRMKGLWC
jgi:hypothetical protein